MIGNWYYTILVDKNIYEIIVIINLRREKNKKLGKTWNAKVKKLHHS